MMQEIFAGGSAFAEESRTDHALTLECRRAEARARAQQQAQAEAVAEEEAQALQAQRQAAILTIQRAWQVASQNRALNRRSPNLWDWSRIDETDPEAWILEHGGRVQSSAFVHPISGEAVCACFNIALREATTGDTTEKRIRGLKLLHLTPAMLFAPGKRSGKEARQRYITQRCKLYQQGSFGKLLDDAHRNFLVLRLIREAWQQRTAPQRRRDAQRTATEREQEEYQGHQVDPPTWARVDKLIAAGQLSRAANTFESHGIAPHTEDTRIALENLHPEPSLPVNMAEWRADQYDREATPRPEITWEQVWRALATIARLSAPGITGLRAEHLRYAFLYGKSQARQFSEYLTALMQMIHDGKIPARAQRWLRTALLIPLLKPAGGIRPIALNECMLKILERLVVRREAGALEAQFITHGQLAGPGVKGGIEAVHRAISLMHARAATEGVHVVTAQLDIKNAFNCISRTAVARSTKTHFPHLIEYVRMMYETPIPLWYVDHDSGDTVLMHSKTGVTQGMPLSQLLFDVATLPLLTLGAAYDGVTTLAIHDDMYITGPPAEVAKTLRDFAIESSRGYGMQLSPGKSKLYSPSWLCATVFQWLPHFTNAGFELLHQAQDAPARPHLSPIHAAQGLTVGGIPLGAPEYIRGALQEKSLAVRKLSLTITKLAARDPQGAQLLARYCVHPKPTHLARALHHTSPGMAEFIATHDTEIMRLVKSLLYNAEHGNVFFGNPDNAQKIAVLDYCITAPMSIGEGDTAGGGGMGFTRLQDVAPLCHYGSHALTAALLDKIPALHGYASDVNMTYVIEEMAPEWVRTWRSTQASVCTMIGPQNSEIEAPPLHELVTQQKAGVQSRLTKLWAVREYQNFRDQTMTSEDRTRLMSTSGPAASAFLQAIPYSPSAKCSPEQFRVMLQFMLDLPQSCLAGVTHCVKGHPMESRGHHCVTKNCGSLFRNSSTGNWQNVRHNVIRDTLRSHISEAGYRSVPEPATMPGMAPDQRGDIKIFDFPGQAETAIVDVVISSLYDSAGQILGADKPQGHFARKAAARKKRHYEPLQRPYYLIPFSAEVYGTLDKEAQGLLATLAKKLTADRLHETLETVRENGNFNRTYNPIITRWRRDISIALAKANADCILRGVDNLRGGLDVPIGCDSLQDEVALMARDLHFAPS